MQKLTKKMINTACAVKISDDFCGIFGINFPNQKTAEEAVSYLMNNADNSKDGGLRLEKFTKEVTQILCKSGHKPFLNMGVYSAKNMEFCLAHRAAIAPFGWEYRKPEQEGQRERYSIWITSMVIGIEY